jgi:hypothetical protein
MDRGSQDHGIAADSNTRPGMELEPLADGDVGAVSPFRSAS